MCWLSAESCGDISVAGWNRISAERVNILALHDVLMLTSVTDVAQLVGSLLETLYTSVLINLMSAVFLNIMDSSILNQPLDLMSMEVVAVEGEGSR